MLVRVESALESIAREEGTVYVDTGIFQPAMFLGDETLDRHDISEVTNKLGSIMFYYSGAEYGDLLERAGEEFERHSKEVTDNPYVILIPQVIEELRKTANAYRREASTIRNSAMLSKLIDGLLIDHTAKFADRISGTIISALANYGTRGDKPERSDHFRNIMRRNWTGETNTDIELVGQAMAEAVENGPVTIYTADMCLFQHYKRTVPWLNSYLEQEDIDSPLKWMLLKTRVDEEEGLMQRRLCYDEMNYMPGECGKD